MPEPVTVSGAVVAAIGEVVAVSKEIMQVINTVSKMPDGEAQLIIRTTQKED